MSRILILGDDTLTPYLHALQAEGHDVALAPPGASAAADAACDLAVLDLPSLGEDAAAHRFIAAAQRGEAPAVIALLSPDQLAAFDPTQGFEDFLPSGATAAELCARVRQTLWKRQRVDSKHLLKVGSLVMDLANYTVHVAGRPVELTFKEYELLCFLATNRGRVFTREALLNKVWGYDFYGGARTVDVHVRRLRSKIEDRHNTFIETVRNVGYRFKTGA